MNAAIMRPACADGPSVLHKPSSDTGHASARHCAIRAQFREGNQAIDHAAGLAGTRRASVRGRPIRRGRRAIGQDAGRRIQAQDQAPAEARSRLHQSCAATTRSRSRRASGESPKRKTASAITPAPNPTACSSTSATMAPGTPRAFCAPALVAVLNDGSSGAYVSSASMTACTDNRHAAPAGERRHAALEHGGPGRRQERRVLSADSGVHENVFLLTESQARSRMRVSASAVVRAVVNQGNADIAAGRGSMPAAIGPGEIGAGQHADAGLAPKAAWRPLRRRLTSSQRKNPPAGR